ncbi:MAG: 5-formyltetrahydrofolate cyclo-ligase [Propionicimonas sp.]|uniref:5-formyltetrahydrofolate cyclo-ligase n=1 Tax=Propionicimonas sp. TaxID=1955623 RepID=UPI003D11003A
MTSAGPEGQPHARRSKAELRRRLRAARAGRPPSPDATDRITQRVLAVIGEAAVVAAYASVPGEPDTTALLEALWRGGTRVLLPVLRHQPDWAWYDGPGSLSPGPRGIPAPGGPSLGPAALGEARVVLLPGLAGTPDGRRLGTGGGWYDRALAWAAPDATLALVLFDDEVRADVPTDPWDRNVHLVVTERRLLDARAE